MNLKYGQVIRARKFRVTVFKQGSRIIEQEETVMAANMALARQHFLARGIPAHRVYVLEI